MSSSNPPAEDKPAPAAPAANDSSDEPTITFTVKASNESKYTLTLPASMAVSEVKATLATSEYSSIPADRQRLIYSGRVLKNEETLDTYKIQSGHTVHLVRGAASNTAPGGGSGSSGAATGRQPAQPQAPANISAGSGNSILSGLTGARYAGQVQLPSSTMFGPDGGMGPPPDPEQMISMMDRPEFQAQMQQMLDNPQVVDMIIQSQPMLQNIPGAREMMRSPMFRQMMTDPNMMRQMAAMQRATGGGPFGGVGGFPAPGGTEQNPSQPGTAPASQGGAPAADQQPPLNPWAAMLGTTAPGAGTPPPHAAGGAASPPGAPAAGVPNPFLNPFLTGFPGTGATQEAGASPFGQLTPEQIQQAMQFMNMSGGMQPGAGTGAGQPPANPYAGLFGPGANPYAAFGGAPAAPADTRPPEERYAEQLGQLNDMGFHDFDQNIAALRRAGGSVQGAINYLLGA